MRGGHGWGPVPGWDGGHVGGGRSGWPAGPGPWRAWHGGHGGPGGRRHGGWARGQMRRIMLDLLAESPRHGYDLMQEIGRRRSGGAWQPSPGTIYPILQQLEDEGLVRVEPADGRRVYHLTDAGRGEAKRQRDEHGDPWPEAGTVGERVRMGMRAREVMLAAMQVARAGSDAQQARAAEVLETARKDLYRLLGEGDAQAPPG